MYFDLPPVELEPEERAVRSMLEFSQMVYPVVQYAEATLPFNGGSQLYDDMRKVELTIARSILSGRLDILRCLEYMRVIVSAVLAGEYVAMAGCDVGAIEGLNDFLYGLDADIAYFSSQ